MPRDDHTKTTRLEARIPKAVQTLLKHAAALQGRSVSDFVVTAALEAAEKAIATNEMIQITLADQKRFAAAMLEPPQVAPALKRAAATHANLVEPS